jgi:hypothetical protein
MKFMQCLKQRRRLASLTLFASMLALAGTAGGAQQIQKQSKTDESAKTKTAVKQSVKQRADEKASAPAEKVEIRVYAAQHTAADQLATMLGSIFDSDTAPFRVTVDDRNNRLVISAAASQWESLEEILKKLDVKAPPTEGETQRIVTLSLQGVTEDENWFQSTLNMLIPKNSNTKFTVDSGKNLLILSGDDKTIEMVRALCDALKHGSENAKKTAAVKETRVHPVQVRLLWLMDMDKKATNDAPLTGDLAKIVPVLNKLGINQPRIVSNCLVSTTMGGTFKTFGTTQLNNGPVRIDLSGRSRMVGNEPNLNVQLRIGSDAPEVKEGLEFAKLDTEIQAPMSHFVILGMTPFQTGTSIFVIQLSEPE